MKKALLTTLTLAAMLMTASCSKEATDEPQNGKQSVQFTVKLPDGINARKMPKAGGPMRAFADGKSAVKLKYAVYSKDGELLPVCANSAKEGEASFNSNSLTTTVTLQLPTDMEYKIVFFAENDEASACGAYNVDFENKTFTVDYAKATASNDKFDAFYTCYNYTGATSNDVKLYRPFAQINIGTKVADKTAASNAGKDFSSTTIKVSKVHNTMNLIDGTVTDDVVDNIALTANGVPESESFPKTGYEYLCMGYVLAGNDPSLIDVTMQNGNGTNLHTPFTNVPVKRNYRTNIYGDNLLTGPSSSFDVSISPSFSGEVVQATNDAELSNALKTPGVTIMLSPIAYNVASNIAAKDVTIEGVEGASLDFNNKEVAGWNNVTFKNVQLDFGTADYKGLTHSDNLKYENCTFTGKHFIYSINTTYDHCTFKQDNVEYSFWTYGADNATFNNCTFISKGKAALVYTDQQTPDITKKVTFNNCKFTASEKSSGKAAIEIDSRFCGFNVYINNCTSEGFDNGSVSGNSLWNNKSGVPLYSAPTTLGANGRLKVYVNNVLQELKGQAE